MLRNAIFRLFSFVGSLLDRIFAAAGAFVFSQMPALMTQYLTLLRGAMVESGRQYAAIHAQAAAAGRTVDQFIAKHLQSSDPEFMASGRVMDATVQRYMDYRDAIHAIQSSPAWKKPFLMLYHLDFNLVLSLKLSPTIPISYEAAVYALVGMIFGMLVYTLFIWSPLTLLFGDRAGRRSRQ